MGVNYLPQEVSVKGDNICKVICDVQQAFKNVHLLFYFNFVKLFKQTPYFEITLDLVAKIVEKVPMILFF